MNLRHHYQYNPAAKFIKTLEPPKLNSRPTKTHCLQTKYSRSHHPVSAKRRTFV